MNSISEHLSCVEMHSVFYKYQTYSIFSSMHAGKMVSVGFSPSMLEFFMVFDP